MSKLESQGDSRELSLEDQRQVDRLCHEFKRELKADAGQRIEDYLDRLPESLRPFALGELLSLELDILSDRGVTLDASAYRRRFPDYADIAAKALQPPAKSPSQESTLSPRADTLKFAGGPLRSSSPADEEIPARMGRYEIRRVLGKGAFGRVYLANDTKLDRLVALKAPSQMLFDSGVSVESFVEEARNAARLKHPGMVAVHDVQQDGDRPFIVQEYIDGGSLADWLRIEQPTHQGIVSMLIEITEAVGFAHQQGLVHRDLKPANILVDAKGHAHVADFGLAVHESVQWNRKGEIFGTPAYMSPELVRGETHRLDGRSDLWSLGVILYGSTG